MLKISPDALKDFQICSLLYEYRHNPDPKQRKIESLDIRDRRIARFDETLKRVLAFFFYKKQSLAEPSYQALLNRWQKLWFAEGTNAVDIANMKNEIIWGSETSYTTQAAIALRHFCDEFADKPEQQVVLVDEKFCVPLNKQVALEGTFDVILREKTSDGYHYKIYKWATTSVKRTASFWTFDMVFLDYAFKYRNGNKSLYTTHYIWNFGGSNIGERQLLLEQDDYDLIKYWSEALVDTEVFAPRRGLTSYCKGCPFDKPCSAWKPPKKVSA